MEKQRDGATEIGVLQRDFWQMTPADLAERMEIHYRREERHWDRAAWMVHHIMSAFIGSKDAPSVDELRGRVTNA